MNSFRKRLIFGEVRSLFFFKEVGSNVREYGHDVNDKYINGPYRNDDVIQKITGPFMAAASIILEGPDQIIAGAVDQQLKRPSGALGRIRRDSRQMLGNLFTLHPLRAAADGLRLVTSGAILDAADVVGGFSTAA